MPITTADRLSEKSDLRHLLLLYWTMCVSTCFAELRLISYVVYTNSFLATLNARNSFTSNIDENTSTRMMSSMPAGVVSPHPTVGSIKMKNITIRIDTSTTKEGNRTTEHSVRLVSTQTTPCLLNTCVRLHRMIICILRAGRVMILG